MGNSESKTVPEPSHVWKSETPVRFSESMLSSLQNSTETDSARAKTLELHIQSRVAAELARLSSERDAVLADIKEKLSAPSDSSPSDSSKSSSSPDLSRSTVEKDLAALRSKLDGRKKLRALEEIDKEGKVAEARDEVVKCLRGKDRRALDCWEEVARFKSVVGEVEKEWVERVVR